MTTGAPLTAARIVATEADELAEAWRECCYRHRSQQPLEAKAMLGAVDWTLRHREARMWASDPVLESVAESFARHANSVEVAVRQMLCLRDTLQRRVVQRVPLEELAETQVLVNGAVDYALDIVTQRASAQIEEAAFLDPLTSLLNRRAMERDLARELGHASRYGRDLGVVGIDLDGLKRVNDELGHAAGDAALRALAEALRAAIRAGDEAYRTGGDEFVLLLRETKREDVPAVTERALAAGAPPFSWGAAHYPVDGSEPNELALVADRRLYQARSIRRRELPPAVAVPPPPAVSRWPARPALAGALRAAVTAVPLVVALVVALAVSRALPPPTSWLQAAAWFAVVLASSAAAAAVVDRAARRLLPLSALLKLSMLFPDRAPSRFAVALRAGSTRELETRLLEARDRGIDDEPAKAAADVLVLAAALSAHDVRTRGHSERVRAYTELIAEQMGLSPDERDRLRWASLLHDIGKVSVQPTILNKRGPLDEHELATIHRHPREGARITAPLRRWLGPWARVVEQHHEHWDGSGYPGGLAGDDIVLGARVVAVADAFDVMTTPRPYGTAVAPAAARAELAANAGGQFDPGVVRAFLEVSLGRVRRAMGMLPALAGVSALAFLVAPVVRLGRWARPMALAGVTVAGSVTVAAIELPAVTAPAVVAAPAPHVRRPFAFRSVPSRPGTVSPAAPATAPAGSSVVVPAGWRPLATTGTPTPLVPATFLPATRPISVTTPFPPPPAAPAPPAGPTAAPDHAVTKGHHPVRIAVLANDVDHVAALVPNSLTIAAAPAVGRARVTGAHSLIYQASDSHFRGVVSFSYRVCDTRGACSIGRVTVDVT